MKGGEPCGARRIVARQCEERSTNLGAFVTTSDFQVQDLPITHFNVVMSLCQGEHCMSALSYTRI